MNKKTSAATPSNKTARKFRTEPPPPSTTNAVSEKDPETGRFLPGNSGFGGRPKGSRNKLTTEFFEDFYAAWQKHGAQALKDVAEKSPRDFVRAAAMLMPREFELRSPLNELTDAKLADLIAAVQSLIAAGPAFKPAGGGRATSKPHETVSL